MSNLFPIIPPERLFSRAEVLQRPSPVPKANGLYAWYFSDVPAVVPTDNCLKFDGKALLYIGIAPDKINKPNSRATLLKRIRQHYSGNAEGSTLRRTLGALLAEQSGFPLRRVGSGKRITLTHAGEQYLDQWMEKNAFVAWVALPEPWTIEHQMLRELSCPLNIKDNEHHSFCRILKKLRSDALCRARELPIADERDQQRRFLSTIKDLAIAALPYIKEAASEVLTNLARTNEKEYQRSLNVGFEIPDQSYIEANEIADEYGIDRKRYRQALRDRAQYDERLSGHVHGGRWRVIRGSPEHAAMIEVGEELARGG